MLTYCFFLIFLHDYQHAWLLRHRIVKCHTRFVKSHSIYRIWCHPGWKFSC